MKTEGVMKLQVTKDYRKFTPSAFNRDVANVDALVKSMQKHGFIPAYPLHCYAEKGKLIVKAGHHRLAAAERLNIPVYYVVTTDNALIHELEHASRNWSPLDFVKCFARNGDESYLTLLDWWQKTEIPMTQVASMLSGETASSSNAIKYVKAGTFKVKDESQITCVSEVVLALQEAGYKWAKDRHFISALSLCSFVEEFDHKVFITKAMANRHLLIQQGNRAQYLDIMEHIYNSRSQTKVSLRFRANEEADKRNIKTKANGAK